MTDEIERLREALADLIEQADRGRHDEIGLFRACERARKALRRPGGRTDDENRWPMTKKGKPHGAKQNLFLVRDAIQHSDRLHGSNDRADDNLPNRRT